MPRLLFSPSQLLLGLVTQRTLFLVKENARCVMRPKRLRLLPFPRQRGNQHNSFPVSYLKNVIPHKSTTKRKKIPNFSELIQVVSKNPLSKSKMHRCRCKAVLNLNSSAAPNGTICYFLNWLIPFIAFAIFFSRSSSRTKLFVVLLPRLRWTTLHATIWLERLIILMVCNVSQVQKMTRSPFSEKQSYQMMTERGERGGEGAPN